MHALKAGSQDRLSKAEGPRRAGGKDAEELNGQTEAGPADWLCPGVSVDLVDQIFSHFKEKNDKSNFFVRNLPVYNVVK